VVQQLRGCRPFLRVARQGFADEIGAEQILGNVGERVMFRNDLVGVDGVVEFVLVPRLLAGYHLEDTAACPPDVDGTPDLDVAPREI